MSPDIIVMPLLPLDDYEERCQFEKWIKLMPAITIGSGLGRDPKLLDRFEYIVDVLKDKVVIGDGDFFWYLSQNLDKFRKGLRNMRKLVLTPNNGELKRLFKAITNKDFDCDRIKDTIGSVGSFTNDIVEIDILHYIPELKELYNYFDGKSCYFIIKGNVDLILSGNKCLVVKNQSSLKRCGGQGDVLSGLATLYSTWAINKNIDIEVGLTMASYINRRASFAAFKKKKLGMITHDMLDEVTDAINELMDDDTLFNDGLTYEFTKV